MPPKSSKGRKGANKAVNFHNWAKTGAIKRLGCLLFIFSFLFVNISAENDKKESILDVLANGRVAEMQNKLDEMQMKLDEKDEEMKKMNALLIQKHEGLAKMEAKINKLRVDLNAKRAAGANNANDETGVLPWLLAVTNRLTPADLLAIFMCFVLFIFAWRTSDISSLRDRISKLNSSAKTTANSDLAAAIQDLATKITTLENSAAKTTAITDLRDKIIALDNSAAKTTAINDLRDKIIALDNSAAKTTAINDLSSQINAMDKCVAELKGICGTHTQMLMNINGKEKQIKPEWQFNDGLNFKKTKGLMLNGIIGQNAKNITIKLSQKNEGKPDEYIGVLQLEIDIEENSYKLSDGNGESKVLTNIKPNLKSGSAFEAFVEFIKVELRTDEPGNYNIWMNNMLIPYKNPQKLDTIHRVEVLGPVTMQNIIQTPPNPYKCNNFKMNFENQQHFELVGKMFPIPDPKPEIWLRGYKIIMKKNESHYPLEFLEGYGSIGPTAQLLENYYEMTKPFSIQIDGSTPNTKFVELGNVFRREIFYKSPKEIKISFDDENFIFTSSVDEFLETNKYEIEGDIIILNDLREYCADQM